MCSAMLPRYVFQLDASAAGHYSGCHDPRVYDEMLVSPIAMTGSPLCSRVSASTTGLRSEDSQLLSAHDASVLVPVANRDGRDG